MPRTNNAASLQSYAFQLRKKLLTGGPVDILLDYHSSHQRFLERVSPTINGMKLSVADKFAWKFAREINILDQRRLAPADNPTNLNDKKDKSGVASRGVYQDLREIVGRVKDIWFPEMEDMPNVCWLKQFTTRKLAHYHFTRDEIAFSLIFDFPDTPAEILSYLAYHELLHRQLGAKRVNGRRYSHTSEFKDHEHLFPNWRDMDKQIARYMMTPFISV